MHSVRAAPRLIFGFRDHVSRERTTPFGRHLVAGLGKPISHGSWLILFSICSVVSCSISFPYPCFNRVPSVAKNHFRPFPEKPHTLYMREINHLRRIMWEKVD